MSEPYHQRPAGPALPSPRSEAVRLPDGHWPGEEKFHVWRTAGPDTIDRDRGVIREYEVYGLLDWHSGPRAAQLKLSRNWMLRLLLVDGKITVEAEVLLYPRAAKLVGSEEPCWPGPSKSGCFRFMPPEAMVQSCCAGSCPVVRSSHSSQICRSAQSRWRPTPPHIIGRVRSASLATRFA